MPQVGVAGVSARTYAYTLRIIGERSEPYEYIFARTVSVLNVFT